VEQKSQSGQGASAHSTIRFGPFELDLRAAELRKYGHKIRLQEQPFQILVELLERPGELVLREEIRRKLWRDDTVVEFDHSINAAVKRLRDSLQDSAERPRYIETLARRGYRFVAPVSYEPEKNVSQPGAPALVSPAPRLAPQLQAHSGLPAPTHPLERRLAVVATVLVALASTAVIYYSRVNQPHVGTASPAAEIPLTSYPGFQRFPSFSPEGREWHLLGTSPGSGIPISM
jgi:DNA-binding winged helix-turn-helix (wHTH) protein